MPRSSADEAEGQGDRGDVNAVGGMSQGARLRLQGHVHLGVEGDEEEGANAEHEVDDGAAARHEQVVGCV